MLDNISSLGPVRVPTPPAPAVKAEAPAGERSFKEILKDSIESVDRLQKEADRVLEKYAKGDASGDQVAVAFRKSQIAFEALLEMRNKLVQAFEEIQHMRV